MEVLQFQLMGKHLVETYHISHPEAPHCDIFLELHYENKSLINAEYMLFNLKSNNIVKGKFYDVHTKTNAFNLVRNQLKEII